MKLVVDIGNSRIKWASVRDGRLGASSAILHAVSHAESQAESQAGSQAGSQAESHAVPRAESLDAALARLFEAVPAELCRALVSNVAGADVAEKVVEAFRRERAVVPELIETRPEQLGVRCAYESPERLGVDRWVAMIAAYTLAKEASPGLPVCVVDAGTTVTFDLVAPDGAHRGGLIMAGPRLSAEMLARHTSRIGSTSVMEGHPRGLGVLGRSTEEAVGHAAWLAVSAAIDRAAGIAADAFARKPVTYLTGGDAGALASWLETDTEYRADLVLEGLALIGEQGEAA